MPDGHQRAEISIAWYQHRTGENNGSNIRLESALVLSTVILMLLRFCQLITVQGIISDKAYCSVRQSREKENGGSSVATPSPSSQLVLLLSLTSKH